jgi:hypothetical protein
MVHCVSKQHAEERGEQGNDHVVTMADLCSLCLAVHSPPQLAGSQKGNFVRPVQKLPRCHRGLTVLLPNKWFVNKDALVHWPRKGNDIVRTGQADGDFLSDIYVEKFCCVGHGFTLARVAPRASLQARAPYRWQPARPERTAHSHHSRCASSGSIGASRSALRCDELRG